MRVLVPFRGTSLMAAALLVLAAGCGGGEDSTGTATLPPRPDPHPRPEGAQVRAGFHGDHGGRYISTVRQGPKTWNVLVTNETTSTIFTSGPLFRTLVGFNNRTQESEPVLCERWESSGDGTVWTFHLRRGLRWSDGHPLTADDVMFTVEVLYDPRINAVVSELASVDGEPFRFEKVDDLTVRVTLPRPLATILNIVGSIYIMPRHVLEDDYRAGTFESAYGVDTPPDSLVTCGPWVLGQYVPQEKVVLRPNPYNFVFDEDGKRLPYLDELVYLIVPDQNAELLRFRNGESDELYFRAEDYATMKDGETDGGYTVHDLGMEMGTNFFWVNLNDRRDPTTGRPVVDPVKASWFGRTEFRRALSHAVDREGIVRTVYYGQGEALYGPIPAANLKWHNPDIPRYPYDLERAEALLDGLGFQDRNGDGRREDPAGNRIAFTLLVQADNRERQAMATVIRDDLAKLGIDLTVAPTDFNSLIPRVMSTYDYDAALLGLTGGVPPDPSQSANVFKSTGQTHFWNPEQAVPATAWEAEIDSLMDLQMGAMDPGQRKAYFDRVQELIAENQPAIYIAGRRGLLAVRDRFRNLQPSVLRPWVLWDSETISLDPAAARAAGAAAGD